MQDAALTPCLNPGGKKEAGTKQLRLLKALIRCELQKLLFFCVHDFPC